MLRPAAGLVLCLALLPSLVRAQTVSLPSGCDEALTRLASGSNGYQARGDRCEGVYARPVAGTALFLASFTAYLEDYRPESLDTLRIRWPGGTNGPLRLRSESIRRGRYFRMDTERKAQDTSYAWPGRLLSSERILAGELGVVGMTHRKLGDKWQTVYLPLSISQAPLRGECRDYLLKLAPGARLSEVYVSLALMADDGTQVRALRSDEPLRLGFYPAERAIPIRLKREELATPGLYYLKVSARLPASTVTATQEYYLEIPAGWACPT